MTAGVVIVVGLAFVKMNRETGFGEVVTVGDGVVVTLLFDTWMMVTFDGSSSFDAVGERDCMAKGDIFRRVRFASALAPFAEDDPPDRMPLDEAAAVAFGVDCIPPMVSANVVATDDVHSMPWPLLAAPVWAFSDACCRCCRWAGVGRASTTPSPFSTFRRPTSPASFFASRSLFPTSSSSQPVRSLGPPRTSSSSLSAAAPVRFTDAPAVPDGSASTLFTKVVAREEVTGGDEPEANVTTGW